MIFHFVLPLSLSLSFVAIGGATARSCSSSMARIAAD
jgi:hypothetical protein